MKVSLDEKVFGLLNFSDGYKLEAIGVRLFDEDDSYVGAYFFGDRYENPKGFLEQNLGLFGEARLYALPGSKRLGLVCKMKFEAPDLCLLDGKSRNYRELKLDLLEMRASETKPFWFFRYDHEKKIWDHRPVLTSSLDSNHGHLP